MDAVLDVAVAHAAEYLASRGSRPVGPTASVDDLRRRLALPLPECGAPPEDVINDLVRGADGGLVGSTTGRFFGWVIGGTLPVALAADWLTSTWDQNAASNSTAPAEAVVEEVCGGWLRELFGLPPSASFAFVTGCQMAHTTALAAARHRLLRDRGWDVEDLGLSAAPALRLLASEIAHESLIRSARLLGLGARSIVRIPTDGAGRIDLAALAGALRHGGGRPTIVCLQAGELNTGAFDPFRRACEIAHDAGAWVHIDGAFGLWVATSDHYRHLLEGAHLADSWATDAHKWLNVPFDSGLVFVADPEAHRAAFAQDTSYSVPHAALRNQKDWNPEWSRRGRAFPVYAAIRALGRAGIAAIVDRCCAHAAQLVAAIGGLPGAEVVAPPVINQGLVRFRGPDGDHGRATDAVIRRVQAGGEAWFGGATWRGMRVMRVSVCNWLTTADDVDRAVAAVRTALAET